jgi:hypothetical protein
MVWLEIYLSYNFFLVWLNLIKFRESYDIFGEDYLV